MVDLRAYWLADAGEDELALDLALLHRVLVLAGHLRHPLRDVGIGLIDRDRAVPVEVGLFRWVGQHPTTFLIAAPVLNEREAA